MFAPGGEYISENEGVGWWNISQLDVVKSVSHPLKLGAGL